MQEKLAIAAVAGIALSVILVSPDAVCGEDGSDANREYSISVLVLGPDGNALQHRSVTVWRLMAPNEPVPQGGYGYTFSDVVPLEYWRHTGTGRTWECVRYLARQDGNRLVAYGLRPGVFRVLGRGGGVTPQGLVDGVRLDANHPAAAVTARTVDGPTLTVRLTDAVTGEPAPADALVQREDGLAVLRMYGPGRLLPNRPPRKPPGVHVVPHLAPGSYRIYAGHRAWVYGIDGYELTGPVKVELAAGKDKEVTIPLQRAKLSPEQVAKRWPWSVCGRATDAAGGPMPDVTVLARVQWGPLVARATTDANGCYRLRFFVGAPGQRRPIDEANIPLKEIHVVFVKPHWFVQGHPRGVVLHAAGRRPEQDIPQGVEPNDVLLPRRPGRLDVPLQPGAELLMSLVDAGDVPLAQQHLRLSPGPREPLIAYGRSDAAGVWEVDVPADTEFYVYCGAARSEKLKFGAAGQYRVRLRMTSDGDKRRRLELLSCDRVGPTTKPTK